MSSVQTGQSGGMVEELERDLRMLEEANAAETAAERRAAVTRWVVAMTVVVIICSFLLANYVHFRSELTEENLLASLRDELETFNPVAMEELHTMGANLLPVYAEEGRKQFEALSPQIAAELRAQIDTMGKDVEADVRAKLSDMEERILQRTSASIFAAYPSLDDPEERAKLNENLARLTEEAALEAIIEFDAKFSGDVRALEEVILGFNLEDGEESTLDLQKKFIRSWLRLLDEEIKRL